MRIDRHMLNWGVFFICLGLIPLGVEQGVIGRNLAAEAWRLWPLFLVALGILILVSRTPARFIGGALVAACWGLILGGVLVAVPGWDACRPDGGSQSGSQSGNLDASSVSIEMSCGTLRVDTTSGGQWTAGWTNSDLVPSIDTSGGTLALRARNNDSWWLNQRAGTWHVSLPTSAQVHLSTTLNGGDMQMSLAGMALPSASVTVNAGSAHVDLSGASVGSISFTVNAGSGALTLGSGSDTNMNASVNLGSLDLCTPSDLGVRIVLKETLAGNNLGSAGYTESGGTWSSPNYDAKAHHATIEASTNLGSLNVNPGGGCR